MKLMKTLAVSLSLIAMPSFAALEVGDSAPDFDTSAFLGGEAFDFDMAATLAEGPVVLYFFPAAFTPGCTVEANEFAKATPEFAEYGATILGVSAGNMDRMQEFSVKECSSKFAVAADPTGDVINAYDAKMEQRPEISSRISYVISPEGEVLSVHEAMQPHGHISESMAAVKSWHASQH